MAVSGTMTASMGAAAVAAVLLLMTADADAQNVCKSTDAHGNVTYRDCPPPSTAPAPDAAGRARESPRSSPAATPGRSAAPTAATRPTYPIVGVPLLIVGMVTALAASIAFLVAAFRLGVWWGLGCVFLWPVSLLFLLLHWNVAGRPFLISLAGLAAALVGYVLLGAGT